LKKLVIICEIAIIVIVLAKIVTFGDVMFRSDAVDRCLSTNSAFADTSDDAIKKARMADVSEDSLLRERKLLKSLMEQKKSLDVREQNLKNAETNLATLKQEIISRIDELRELEGRLSVLVASIKEVEEEKYKGLAKIYESFPPAHAGSMLEKLDKETAAAIIMNMKSKKAGAVWEHMNSKKAVEITREITNIQLSSQKPNEP